MTQTLLRHDLTQAQRDGLTAVIVIALALAAGIIVHRIVFGILARLAKRRERMFGAIVRRACRPAAYILPLLAVSAVAPMLYLPPDWADWGRARNRVGDNRRLWRGESPPVVLLGSDYAKGLQGEPGEDDIPFRQIETRVDILSRVAVTHRTVAARQEPRTRSAPTGTTSPPSGRPSASRSGWPTWATSSATPMRWLARRRPAPAGCSR